MAPLAVQSAQLGGCRSIASHFVLNRWSLLSVETFSLTHLLPQYLCLYKICELNWLPGFHVDAMIKNRLRFLFAFVKNMPIDFGVLVYDQVIEMSRIT
ncbi:hypothetical protein Bca52824_032768 [Brassica carinata]|uniref:Uncharacterized protein n=1 Tax=Brassica carinata TaxID=52824 RepID=A0A8X7SD43_BRACI|nr:hypothetical protein Bca52824_032768 [Brassica carinata]